MITSYYTLRGGHSNNSAYCGAFCVNASAPASVTHWSGGTALSFKIIASYYYIRRGGLPNSDVISGSFSLNASGAFSDTGWFFGAALSCNFILCCSWWQFCL